MDRRLLAKPNLAQGHRLLAELRPKTAFYKTENRFVALTLTAEVRF